jgi:hypothetical protein
MHKELEVTNAELEMLADGLAKVFILRRDLYARQFDDGSYICVRKPLTIGHVARHLKGELTLGAYLLDTEDRARYLVFDADDEPQLERLVKAARELENQGAFPYLEQSRRGGHLWLFFYQPIPAWKVRVFGKGLAAVFELTDLEMFPKQDRLKEGPGSLIRLPFGVHRRTGQRYVFVTTKGEPIAPTRFEQIRMLSAPRTVPKAVFTTYRDSASSAKQKPENGASEAAGNTLSQRIKSSVTAVDFISRFVELSPNGVGHCPFHDDSHNSFAVSTEGNYWHCFAGCGGGSIIDFWMKWRDCDFRAALKELAGMLLD